MIKRQTFIKDIVLTAMLTAILFVGKQALAIIPNVEVVTLFIMVFAATLRPRVCFLSTMIFVVIESMLWGVNGWVISYIIHWNSLCMVTYFFAQVIKIKNRFVYLAIATVMTTAFGVLSSTVDAILSMELSGFAFGALFVAIYLRGVYFYIIHIVSNTIINAVLFVPLCSLIKQLNTKYNLNVARPHVLVENTSVLNDINQTLKKKKNKLNGINNADNLIILDSTKNENNSK